jgi:hypothetical protein
MQHVTKELWRNRVFLSGIHGSETDILKEVVIQKPADPMKMLKKCGILFLQIRRNSQTNTLIM